MRIWAREETLGRSVSLRADPIFLGETISLITALFVMTIYRYNVYNLTASGVVYALQTIHQGLCLMSPLCFFLFRLIFNTLSSSSRLSVMMIHGTKMHFVFVDTLWWASLSYCFVIVLIWTLVPIFRDMIIQQIDDTKEINVLWVALKDLFIFGNPVPVPFFCILYHNYQADFDSRMGDMFWHIHSGLCQWWSPCEFEDVPMADRQPGTQLPPCPPCMWFVASLN